MERYRNLSGKSGVVSYEIIEGGIKVKFQDGAIYLYNNVKPGSVIVQKMIDLARSGTGLNSYISKVVKKSFYRKY